MSNALPEIDLQPDVLRWARERAGLAVELLAKKMNLKPDRVLDWEASGRIRLNQVDKLAHHTHTPLGFLYLPTPADESLPIPDFRAFDDHRPHRPSPDLLDTIHQMRRRQGWMREQLLEEGEPPLGIVGSITLQDTPEQAAAAIRQALGLAPGWAADQSNWTEAQRHLRERIEAAGVIVVLNGIVGNDTHRKLDVGEFRGFALVDAHSPLVFINGADFKAAQTFTLMHEAAHVWLGREGISNFDAMQPAPFEIERFCDQVAAEFLVPAAELDEVWGEAPEGPARFDYLARRFKVSSIVTARRALDIGLIDRAGFFEFYNAWQADERRRSARQSSGGDFWNTQSTRIGRRFGRAVSRAVKEGRILYRDAYALTGLKGETFDKYIQTLGE